MKNLFLYLFLFFTLSACSIELTPPVPPELEAFSNNKGESKLLTAANIIEEERKNTNFIKAEDWSDLKNILENSIYSEGVQSKEPKAKKNILEISNQEDFDIIKSDGVFVYSLLGDKVIVSDLSASINSKIVSEIKFNFKPKGLQVNNNRLIVLGESSHNNQNYIINKFHSLTLVDLSDKKNLKILKTVEIEGGLLAIDISDNILNVVSKIENVNYKKGVSMLPKLLENGLESICVENEVCSFPEVYYIDAIYGAIDFISVSSINLNKIDQKAIGRYFLLPPDNQIFLDKGSLLVTYKNVFHEKEFEAKLYENLLLKNLSLKSQENIKIIKTLSSTILNKSEKLQKTASIYEFYLSSLPKDKQNKITDDLKRLKSENYKEIFELSTKNVVEHVSFNDNKISFEPNGSFFVDQGSTLIIKNKKNSFLASSDKNTTNILSFSNKLEKLSTITKENNEANFSSMEILGDRLYLLNANLKNLVININNPDNLQLENEINFSNNIQKAFLFENYLLTFSNEPDNQKIGVKCKLQILSGAKEPKQIDYLFIEGAELKQELISEIGHGMFSFESKVASLPISTKNFKGGIFGDQGFDGIVVLGVSEEKISLKGLIDHADFENDNNKNNSKDIKRVLIAKGTFISYSETGLKYHALKGLTKIGAINFSLIK